MSDKTTPSVPATEGPPVEGFYPTQTLARSPARGAAALVDDDQDMDELLDDLDGKSKF